MKFSVVIPAFNASGTIDRALDSCRQQSLSPHEIIVVDDASTDDTAHRVQQYPDVTLLQLHPNQGSSRARNAGWEIASGDYIVFLDSDDRWHPEKLEITAHYLRNRSDLVLLYHDYTLTGFPGGKMDPLPALRRPSFLSHLVRNTAQTSCICISKNCRLRFSEGMRYCEDYDLLLQAAYRYNTARLPLPLTQLDRPQGAPGGLSGDRRAMRKGEWKAYYRLGRLHPAFLLLLPALWVYSVSKHLWKGMRSW